MVIFASVPFIAICLALSSRKLQLSISDHKAKLDVSIRSASCAIRGIETVKCFNAQDLESRKYCQALQIAARSFFQQASLNGIQLGVLRFLTLIMFVQGFWYGSVLVNSKRRSTAQVLTTFWAAIMAAQGLQQALPHLVTLERGKAAGLGLQNLMQEVDGRSSSDKSQSQSIAKPLTGGILLKDVRDSCSQ